MANKPWQDRKQHHLVHGHRMAVVDEGSGPPIVFLHGNPTSSFLWRDILPHLTDNHRCIAPDLIGMGDSERPPELDYRFVDHRTYLDQLLKQLALDDPILFVVHDWGSALGFDWTRRHPTRVAGIAYMEAIVRPLEWNEFNEQARPVFEGFRSPAGEVMVLENNLFIERVLPGSILRRLPPRIMDEYRRPWTEPGDSRLPMLVWPREIPLDGEPADVTQIVADYANWMERTAVPKLFINAEPGAIMIGAPRRFCRNWPNQVEVTVPGSHFIQEDSAELITKALRDWIIHL
ncbi:MAG: haloalkane dehalogenase [Geminicoccaceae bacterium]